MIVLGKHKPVLGGSAGFRGAPFFLPLNDLGSGEVNLVLNRGTGSATYTNASAVRTTISSAGLIIPVSSGVPRSWYWPDTLAYGGYLAEGARTNLCLQSEVFDNASWSKTDTTVTANNTTSPDGTATADLLTEGTAGSAACLQAITVTADVTHSESIWLKRGNSDWVRFSMQQNGASANRCDGWINLATGAVGSVANGGTATGAAISRDVYQNGWYRVKLSGAVNNGATSVVIFTCSAASDTSVARVNNATRYQWGAQFENNVTFASSYIPTTTAAVTRNADVLTFVFAGNADATQGTAYAELGILSPTGGGGGSVAIGFSTANDAPMNIGGSAATTSLRINDGTTNVEKAGLTDMRTASRKRVTSWGADLAITGDGATVTTGVFDGTVPSTAIGIGCSTGGANPWFGPIKNVAIWKHQFADGGLQNLTA